MTYGDSFSRGEKRKRDSDAGSELIGLGATVARLNGDSEGMAATSNAEQVALDDADAHKASQEKRDGDDGWQTVSRGAKRQKKEVANYPSIHQSNSARLQSFVKISDLQNLVFYLLADGNGPQWIGVRHKREIERVVCLLVPGLEADMFNGQISLDPEEKKEEDTKAGDEIENADMPDQTANTNVVPTGKPQRSYKPNNPDEYYPTKLNPTKLPKPLAPLADIFSHIWPIVTPGEYNRMHSPLYAMLNAPIPKNKEAKKTKGPKPPNVGNDFLNKRAPITDFLATKEELGDNGFAVHPVYLKTQDEKDFEAARRHKFCRTAEDGWIDLPEGFTDIYEGAVPFSDVEPGCITQGRQVLFLDCEMVTTTLDKFALARVSLLDWSGQTIMDELVQPPDPVKDYLTQYSGISKAMLDPVTTTLADIQAKLKTLLTPQTILAGHSLDSDLKALKISFPFIVDTTLLYPHPKGPPQKSSLKWLCQKYLSREIQNRGPQGHDSVEDARACLDLVKQKCEKGKTWGTSEATGESIFKRLGRYTDDTTSTDDEGRTGAVVDWGNPQKGYGGSATVAVACENDNDVVAGVKRVVLGSANPSLSHAEIAQAIEEDTPRRGVDFTWARLRELEALRGWWNRTKTPDAAARLARTLVQPSSSFSPDTDTDTELSTAALATAVEKTVANIRQIYESLPPKTAFFIYSGSGDPRELKRLTDMHAEFKKAYQTTKWDELPVQWTDFEEQGLKEAAKKARLGIGFVVCK
ncbi:hypothetical protein BDV97DRAFT_371584 [Delphinella strobiligena]|nr:hypothetical protein BDV97DRAFT_371584 [Delphinella strobiligena]